jgi:putative transcriptional regulator
MQEFNIETVTNYNPKNGHVLIAEPFLNDPEFSRAVVYICNHDADGTFGLIVNQPLQETLQEIIPEITTMDWPIYHGGPLQKEIVFIIHHYPELLGGHFVSDGIYVGAENEKLYHAFAKNLLTPNKIKFFLGYSSWAAGQLDQEMVEKSWLVAPAQSNNIFSHANNDIYKNSLLPLGKKYSSIALLPKHPTLN